MPLYTINELCEIIDEDLRDVLLGAIDLKWVLQNDAKRHIGLANRPVVSVGGGITSSLLVPIYCIENKINPVYVYGAVKNDDQELIDIAENELGIEVWRVDPSGNVNKNFKGFDIWSVYFHTGFLGNSRIDPCSRVLKREAIQKFMKAHDTKQLYLGIKADELSRWISIVGRYKQMGIEAICPLYDNPNYFGDKTEQELSLQYLDYVPMSYKKGSKHNNCDDFCVKSGWEQLKRSYWYDKPKFRRYARLEYWFNVMYGTEKEIKYTIYSKTVNGVKVGVPLSEILDGFDIEFATTMFSPYAVIEEISCRWCD